MVQWGENTNPVEPGQPSSILRTHVRCQMWMEMHNCNPRAASDKKQKENRRNQSLAQMSDIPEEQTWQKQLRERETLPQTRWRRDYYQRLSSHPDMHHDTSVPTQHK